MSQSPTDKNFVINAVEDFIKDFHSGDIILSPKAMDIELTLLSNKKSLLGQKKLVSKCIADLLAWAIAAYLLYKDTTPSSSMRIEIAYECLDYIERARAYGVVIPQKLTSRLKDCEEQNGKLKELNEKLSRDNVHQKKLIEELHKTINTLTGKGLKNAGANNP